MVHVDAGLLASDKDIRDFGERLLYEMLDDTAQLGSKWRRDDRPDARLFGRDDFWYGNLLMAGEVWPHRLPESLPFLGGVFVEIDEGVGAMAMHPGMVEVTSRYLNSLQTDELRARNAGHFSDDGFGTVEDQLALGAAAIASLRDFYALGARNRSAVVNVGCVV